MNILKRRPRKSAHDEDKRLTDAGNWIVEPADYTVEEQRIQKGERA